MPPSLLPGKKINHLTFKAFISFVQAQQWSDGDVRPYPNMEIKPTIHRITIYPVKSLDGIPVQKAQVVKGGCLQHDREYAIIGNNGNFIIGKTNPLVHLLRSTVDFENETISLRHEDQKNWNNFNLQKDKNTKKV